MGSQEVHTPHTHAATRHSAAVALSFFHTLHLAINQGLNTLNKHSSTLCSASTIKQAYTKAYRSIDVTSCRV